MSLWISTIGGVKALVKIGLFEEVTDFWKVEMMFGVLFDKKGCNLRRIIV